MFSVCISGTARSREEKEEKEEEVKKEKEEGNAEVCGVPATEEERGSRLTGIIFLLLLLLRVSLLLAQCVQNVGADSNSARVYTPILPSLDTCQCIHACLDVDVAACVCMGVSRQSAEGERRGL